MSAEKEEQKQPRHGDGQQKVCWAALEKWGRPIKGGAVGGGTHNVRWNTRHGGELRERGQRPTANRPNNTILDLLLLFAFACFWSRGPLVACWIPKLQSMQEFSVVGLL